MSLKIKHTDPKAVPYVTPPFVCMYTIRGLEKRPECLPLGG